MRVVYVANKQMITVDFKTKAFMKTLSLISKDAIPNAAALTLNFTADQVTKQQISNARNGFLLRTPFTLRSMTTNRARPYKALNKASGKKLKTMFSKAGTFSPYLWMHEDGHTIKGKDNGPIPIATKTARVSKSKRKVIARRNRLNSSNSLRNGSTFTSEKGVEMRVMKPRGTNKGRPRKFGVYTITRGKMKMLRNLETSTVSVKGKGFHSRAVQRKGNNQLIAQRFKKYGQRELNKAVRKYG